MAEKSLVNDPELMEGVAPDVVAEPPPAVVAEELDFFELPHPTRAIVTAAVVAITPARLTETDMLVSPCVDSCLLVVRPQPACTAGLDGTDSGVNTVLKFRRQL